MTRTKKSAQQYKLALRQTVRILKATHFVII